MRYFRTFLRVKSNLKWLRNGFDFRYSTKTPNEKDKLFKNLKDKLVKQTKRIQGEKVDTIEKPAANVKSGKSLPNADFSQRNLLTSLNSNLKTDKKDHADKKITTNVVDKEKSEKKELNVKNKSEVSIDKLKEAAKSDNGASQTDMFTAFLSFFYGETPPKSSRPIEDNPKPKQPAAVNLMAKEDKKENIKKADTSGMFDRYTKKETESSPKIIADSKKDKEPSLKMAADSKNDKKVLTKKSKSESLLITKKRPKKLSNKKSNPVLAKSKEEIKLSSIPEKSSLTELRKPPRISKKSKEHKIKNLDLPNKPLIGKLVDAKKNPTATGAYSSPLQSLTPHVPTPSSTYLQQHAAHSSKQDSSSENKNKDEYNFPKDLGLGDPKVSLNKNTDTELEKTSKKDSGLTSFLNEKLEEKGVDTKLNFQKDRSVSKKAEENATPMDDLDLMREEDHHGRSISEETPERSKTEDTLKLDTKFDTPKEEKKDTLKLDTKSDTPTEVQKEAKPKSNKKRKKAKLTKAKSNEQNTEKVENQKEETKPKDPDPPPFISDPSIINNRRNTQQLPYYNNYNYNYNATGYDQQQQQQQQQQSTYDKTYRYSAQSSFPTKAYYQAGRSQSHPSPATWGQHQYGYNNQNQYNYNYNQNYSQPTQSYNQQTQNYNQQYYPGGQKHYVYPQNMYAGYYQRPSYFNYTPSTSATVPAEPTKQTWSKEAVGDEHKLKNTKNNSNTPVGTPNVHSKNMSTESKLGDKNDTSNRKTKKNKKSSKKLGDHAKNLLPTEWTEIED